MITAYQSATPVLSKREELISLASQQFNRVGFNATSVKEISESIGLSKTALYHYVKDKQELLFLCYLNSLDGIENALEHGLKATGPERVYQAINHLFQQYEDAALGLRPHCALVFEGEALNTEQEAIVNKYYFKKLGALAIELISGTSSNKLLKKSSNTIKALFFLNILTCIPLLLGVRDVSAINKVRESLLETLSHGMLSTNKQANLKCGFATRITNNFITQLQIDESSTNAFYRAGAELFTERGYHQTSIDQLAEHLNLTKGAFYHHFRNKVELLSHTLMQSITLHQYVFSESFYNSRNSGHAVQQATRALQLIQASSAGPLAMHYTRIYLPEHPRQQLDIEEQKLDEIIGNLIKSGYQDNSINHIDTDFSIRLLKAVIQMSVCVNYYPEELSDYDRMIGYTAILFYGLEG